MKVRRDTLDDMMTPCYKQRPGVFTVPYVAAEALQWADIPVRIRQQADTTKRPHLPAGWKAQLSRQIFG
jgi:hypothetical protein